MMGTYPESPILIVDDNLEDLNSVELLLLSDGFNNIKLCNDSRLVEKLIKETDFSIILMDLEMPHISGSSLLTYLQENFPDIPVIIITGSNDLETAIKCMKLGAYDFFLKPINNNIFSQTLNRAVKNRTLQLENKRLRNQIFNNKIKYNDAFSKILTNNKKMFDIFKYIEAISISSEPVLITGECGVGKESIAQAIYKLSGRCGEFVAVNIAGLDDTLFSDTLFGHKRGAYTGADSIRKGLIEKAHDGTLFLDEIGDLNPASQVKLLRLIQEKEYCPLGTDMPVKTNAHIVTATNKDLKKLALEKKFRNDLFYRLDIHSLNIPALRERMDDILLLTEYFIEMASLEYKKPPPKLTQELIAQLNNYSFPGNIRQLRSIIFDAVCRGSTQNLFAEALHARLSSAEDAPIEVDKKNGGEPQPQAVIFPGKLPSLKDVADLLVKEALSRSGGNQSLAAKMIGVSHQALSKRLKIRDSN